MLSLNVSVAQAIVKLSVEAYQLMACNTAAKLALVLRRCLVDRPLPNWSRADKV